MKIEPQGTPIGGGETDRRCFSSLMNYVWEFQIHGSARSDPEIFRWGSGISGRATNAERRLCLDEVSTVSQLSL